MKVSVNWLKQLTDIDISVDELVAKIGAQLGAVEEVIDVGAKYKGIVVAKVVECKKHENADKLNVCLIDDGGVAKGVDRNENGYVQVVCGAPNVREGLTVAWLPPGATVPSTYDKEPFVLEARELRGVISNGMLASATELAISEDHSGLLIIDIDAQPGTDFASLYELNDYVIDIENKMFTHRPDCFGILGVAREVAGILGNQFVSPDWYRAPLDRIKPGKTKLNLMVSNEIPNLVPRFMAVAMADVNVGQSPIIIQSYLSRIGLRPINNVVDVTNYLMVLTGQPTHAYDADKLVKVSGSKQLSLEARMSHKGDKLKLLNGKELLFADDSTVLITSGDVPVGVGGIMGGADTEVDSTTKNIVIECANFDMYSIRRTSMKHGLFTDAVTRFNKGQSALQNDVVLEEAVTTLQYVTGGHVASDVVDISSAAVVPKPSVTTTQEFINTRLGADLAPQDMLQLLANVEFSCSISGDQLEFMPPYWRTDIDIAEDLVEEIGRLYGFDNLPINLPMRTIKAAEPNGEYSLKTTIRNILSRAGANEVLTYSFVHGDLLDKVGQNKDHAFMLSNAISPELQYFRLSLLPSLLDKVNANIRAGFNEYAIFEINKSHTKQHANNDEGLPKELQTLALVTAAKEGSQQPGAAYYTARKYLDVLATNLGVQLRYEPFSEPPTYPAASVFDYTRSARVYIGSKILGVVGEFKPDIAKSLKLPVACAGFEIGIGPSLTTHNSAYTKISKYPSVEQDVSLKVNEQTTYSEVFELLNSKLMVPSNSVYSLLPLDIYHKKGLKHFTFRLKITSYDKTLTSAEVNNLLDEVAIVAKDILGAERI